MKKTRAFAWNPEESVGETARRELPRLVAEFFALGRTAAGPASTPAQLHAFRLMAKRFRYTLELFAPLYGPALEARLDQVRKIQGLLGDRQDRVVLSERLRARAGEAGPIHDVLAKLTSEGRALEEKFRRYWRETFDAPGAELLWTRYLVRHPAGTGTPSAPVRKRAAGPGNRTLSGG